MNDSDPVADAFFIVFVLVVVVVAVAVLAGCETMVL